MRGREEGGPGKPDPAHKPHFVFTNPTFCNPPFPSPPPHPPGGLATSSPRGHRSSPGGGWWTSPGAHDRWPRGVRPLSGPQALRRGGTVRPKGEAGSGLGEVPARLGSTRGECRRSPPEMCRLVQPCQLRRGPRSAGRAKGVLLGSAFCARGSARGEGREGAGPPPDYVIRGPVWPCVSRPACSLRPS